MKLDGATCKSELPEVSLQAPLGAGTALHRPRCCPRRESPQPRVLSSLVFHTSAAAGGGGGRTEALSMSCGLLCFAFKAVWTTQKENKEAQVLFLKTNPFT